MFEKLHQSLGIVKGDPRQKSLQLKGPTGPYGAEVKKFTQDHVALGSPEGRTQEHGQADTSRLNRSLHQDSSIQNQCSEEKCSSSQFGGPQLQKEFLMIRLRSLSCFSEHRKKPPHVTRGLLGLCSKRKKERKKEMSCRGLH